MAQTNLRLGTAWISDDEAGNVSINLGGLLVQEAMTIGGVGISTDGNISSGVNTFIEMAPASNDMTLNGDITVIDSIAFPDILANNATGDHIAGEASLTGAGNVTVSTTKAKTDSVIIVSPKEVMSGILYIAGISDGSDFVVASTAGMSDNGKKFMWSIINIA